MVQLLLLSLYMLNMVSLPHSPLKVTIMMLLEGQSICSQASMLSVDLISVSVHVLSEWALCVEG